MVTCKCINGHVWNAHVLEDDPDTNVMTLSDGEDVCPECGSDEFTFEETDVDPHED